MLITYGKEDVLIPSDVCVEAFMTVSVCLQCRKDRRFQSLSWEGHSGEGGNGTPLIALALEEVSMDGGRGRLQGHGA